jgi:dipeptidyl aminopeptidase/acylaminoacyl peptidase
MISLLLAAAVSAAERPPVTPERLALVRDTTEVRVSPDGARLAFITDITGALEVWTVPADGGWPTQLTDLGEQAADLHFSPDGKWLVFASDFGGDERPDLYRVPAAGGEVEKLTQTKLAETSPRFSRDGKFLAYRADPDREFLFQLMVMDLETRKVRQLTKEPMNVHQPVWSPDGKLIAVTRSGDDQNGELLLVDAGGGSVRSIASPERGGIIFAQDFTPNGRSLLCVARNKRGFMQLYMLDVRSGGGRFIGPEQWDVAAARLHPGAGVVFVLNEAGIGPLYRLTGPNKWVRLTPEQGFTEAFDLDDSGRLAAVLWSDSAHPRDVWLVDVEKGKRRGPVTSSLPGGVEPARLARGELVKYPSFDERGIYGFFMEPPVKRLGNPPPAVVVAHGGPDWQVFDDFQALRQSLTEAGFAVLAPNFRGSSGFGKEFLDANNKDWGGADLEDLAAGVRTLAAQGRLDPKRVGITGGSYGGYLTLMGLTKGAGVYAAGVEAYGMPDLAVDYEIAKSRFMDWYETEMGNPTTHAQLFKDRSAINYLDKIKAPLLIFQGANDTNVPKAESELIFKKLKERGHDVALTIYPDEGHGFTKRRNNVDYYRKTVDFFVKHLGK